nr:hypothetical protein [Amnibacterium sp.]
MTASMRRKCSVEASSDPVACHGVERAWTPKHPDKSSAASNREACDVLIDPRQLGSDEAQGAAYRHGRPSGEIRTNRLHLPSDAVDQPRPVASAHPELLHTRGEEPPVPAHLCPASVRLRVDDPHAGGRDHDVVDVGRREASIGATHASIVEHANPFESPEAISDRAFPLRPLRPRLRRCRLVYEGEQKATDPREP